MESNEVRLNDGDTHIEPNDCWNGVPNAQMRAYETRVEDRQLETLEGIAMQCHQSSYKFAIAMHFVMH